MTCPAFGSSSEVSLWYAIDNNPSTDIATTDTITFYEVPMTSESLTANLSSTISDRITAQRSYAGSKLSQGEVSGDIGFEGQATPFVYNMLIAALQADQAFGFTDGAVAGTDGVAISAAGTSPRTVDLTGLTAQDGAQYTVNIGTTAFTYTAATGTSLDTIGAGLTALIEAHATYGATYDTGTDVISITGADSEVITFESFYAGGGWLANVALVNGSTKKCLMFLKRIQTSGGNYDFYLFRGCQVGSISFECSPNALVTGSINVMGIRPQTPIENIATPGTWTFTAAPAASLMSGVDSLREFEISVGGVGSGVTMQSLTITINNQLRQQQAVGLGHPFAAGIASGRIQVTFSGSAYYASPDIYTAFVSDSDLAIEGKLVDSNGKGFSFLADYVKVTSGGLPTAGGPDQDLMIDTEFQAFESASHGSLEVTRLNG